MSHQPVIPVSRRHGTTRLAAVLLLVIIAGCGSEPPISDTPATTSSTELDESSALVSPAPTVARETAIRFEDVAATAGVRFTYQNGADAKQATILESLGGGVAVLDLDSDGREDLLFPGGGRIGNDLAVTGLPGGLFRNRGDWRFDDVSSSAGATTANHYSHGAAAADFDGDGFRDVLITGYGGLQLLHNLGDGTFEEIATPGGLTDALWSSSAGWGDINCDGFLDVYVCHYVNWSKDNHPVCDGPQSDIREICPPRDFEGLPDTLYFGDGSGSFTDQSAAMAIRPDGKGLSVLVADVNADHGVDIYVANDTVPNVLYQSSKSSGLKDVSLMSGASLSDRGIPDGSMGVELLDYNLDGLFDLWVTNYERETSALYENHENLLFRHSSQRTGVTAVGALFVGWGTSAMDADLDGDEDIAVSNGHVILYPQSGALKQQPLLFENQDGKRLDNVATEVGEYFRKPHMGRGVAAGDLDNDGDPDLAVSHNNAPVAVLRNQFGGDRTWLKIQLVGTHTAREAIGTVVRVTTTDSTGQVFRQVRQWKSGGSYASTGSRWLHFGLANAETVSTVDVEWPSGLSQRHEDVAVNSAWLAVEDRPELFSIPQ